MILIKLHREINEVDKNEVHIIAGKVHNYMWLNTASIKSSVGNKTRPFLSPFHVSTSSCLTLAGAFRNDHVAACSTALRIATEEIESSGCVTVHVRPNWHSIVAQRIGWKISDVTRSVKTERIQNKYSLLKSRSVIRVNRYWKLVGTVNRIKILTSQVS